MVKDFKDDINKETTVMDRTHGPLGFPRLTDLTIGQRRVGDFFDRHYSPREDRGEDPPLCVCFPNSKIQTRCSGVDREGILSELLKGEESFPSLSVHHSSLFLFNLLTIAISSQLSAV
jgi:hypothetical protein